MIFHPLSRLASFPGGAAAPPPPPSPLTEHQTCLGPQVAPVKTLRTEQRLKERHKSSTALHLAKTFLLRRDEYGTLFPLVLHEEVVVVVVVLVPLSST